MLTVEVQTDGGAAFPEFVLGRHLVLASVLYSDVHQRHRHVVRVLILLDNHLRRGREARVVKGVAREYCWLGRVSCRGAVSRRRVVRGLE